jgi:hypothetical protein
LCAVHCVVILRCDIDANNCWCDSLTQSGGGEFGSKLCHRTLSALSCIILTLLLYRRTFTPTTIKMYLGGFIRDGMFLNIERFRYETVLFRSRTDFPILTDHSGTVEKGGKVEKCDHSDDIL